MGISIHRKDLVKLGLKNTHLSAIVSRSMIFRNAPKRAGYALSFSYDQAFLLYVGCELYSLGLSFRHVDDVLVKITGRPFKEIKQIILKKKWLLLVQKDSYFERFAKMGFSTTTTDPFTGEAISVVDKVRKAPIDVLILPEQEYNSLKDKISSILRINLYTIVKELDGIFEK